MRRSWALGGRERGREARTVVSSYLGGGGGDRHLGSCDYGSAAGGRVHRERSMPRRPRGKRDVPDQQHFSVSLSHVQQRLADRRWIQCPTRKRRQWRTSPRQTLTRHHSARGRRKMLRSRATADAPAKLLRPLRSGGSKIACAFLPARRVRISSPVRSLEVLKAEHKLERWRSEGRCSSCWLQHAQCVCSRLAPLAGVATNRVDVALSVHYKEWGCTKNTAKLLPLVLEGCRAAVYPIEPLLPPRRGPTLLLFPGEGSQPASTYRAWVAAQQERVTLVVVDGTWSQARTMARHLLDVPRVHVSESSLVKRAGESLVRHRKQPQARAFRVILPQPNPDPTPSPTPDY